ncbi:MAG: serine/threonine-protein kinase [Kofleriaceae bacterium]
MTMDGAPPASGSFPEMPSSPSLVGEVLDGRYRLVRKLGEGGMGEVYAADHVHIEKRFAVKLLKQEIVSNPEAVSRFRQEARSASSIGHRNIIAIEDFGQLPDGRIYMCMELLDGAPLNDLIKQPMPPERLVNILIQTGHGLAAAHAKGIVHRDMKPENIFVTWGPGGEDIPKLLDFGIAKVAGNEGQNNLTRTGTIFGTPFYMAPEQALGTAVDHRTDIYAMGVIMYEVFSGSLPFQGESFMGILTQHITTEPEPVLQRAMKAGRVLPPGMDAIISRCMQKDPANRFSSMDELVAMLVDVYRVIAGAGMSAYMEAFPVGAQSSSQLRPGTPPPYVPPTGAHAVGQSGPYQQQSGGVPGVQPPSTGSYGYDPGGSSVMPPKRSKVGLIFAIIAVLGVVGAAVGFMVMGGKRAQQGADAGAAPDALVAAVVDAGGVVEGVDAGVPLAVDAALPPDAAPPDAGPEEVDAGPEEVDAGPEEVDAGPEPAAMVEVVLSVSPPEAKVFDGRRELSGLRVKFNPRRSKRVTVKAPGYKSKTVTLTGRDSRVSVTLDKEAPPPPKLDCRDRLVDRNDKVCLAQFCRNHSTELECAE